MCLWFHLLTWHVEMAAPVRHSLSAGGVPREPVPTPDGAVLTEKLGSGSYATVYKGYRRVWTH